ncbi:IS66 family insertion sequence element accessory protein TnpB [Lactobacillus sp. ESL0791]|uniref:IS66 family insertion sequence element accessory protein TnpB n=1 Tax=Lactobacillus sp. ESL0791 TaxID=2983234 RepID=UPI0023F9D539|nr:IS66 family insertion sequence element accessory protein TnpB [Lactobacillus sp. ESL0791]MDF7639620.1 IS66 family insertion sequence element accessory protein TnpB [Lactobacillus sp. ESL0791]
MRAPSKGIDGLITVVQNQFKLDPYCSSLFLFCGTRKDRFKGLLWENDGFLLL